MKRKNILLISAEQQEILNNQQVAQ